VRADKRQRAAELGRDTAQTSSRRVAALAALSHWIVQQSRLRTVSDFIDPVTLQMVQRLFIDTMRAAISETLGAEGDGFAKEVERKIRDTPPAHAEPG
jgi:short subunit dehydrogenase-like uncharacterized protein